jgi:hypothetical protein
MKFIICFVLLTLLTSCATNNPTASNGADKQPVANNSTNNKILGLLQESRKANSSAAISKLVKKVKQDPGNPELIYTLAYEHMQNAQTNKSVREHDLAISYFSKVLEMVPGSQAVLLSLYYIYYNDTINNHSPTSFENAKRIFMQVPESSRGEMNPPSLAKYALTVIWQETQHQPDHQYLRGILLDAMHELPSNDVAYIELAKLYSEDHYFALALATLKLGAENIHDSVELYKAIGITYEKRAEANGCNYEHSSDIANAAKYYKMAIPLKPTEQSLHYNLSRTLFDQNLNNLGLHEADIALELEASKIDLAIAAQNYSMLGNNKKANTLLGRAMESGYTMSETGYHEIFMNEGDWKTAAKGFSAYISGRTTYSVYDLIKSDIIAQQAQQKPWIVNKKISLNSDWEENLFKYWDTKITADELKTMAHTSCEKTEYYFYTGYQDYRDGKIELAKSKFSAAINQNTYRFIERPLARYFLQK